MTLTLPLLLEAIDRLGVKYQLSTKDYAYWDLPQARNVVVVENGDRGEIGGTGTFYFDGDGKLLAMEFEGGWRGQ